MNWNTNSINNNNNNDTINAVMKRKNKTEFRKQITDHKEYCNAGSIILFWINSKFELLLTTSINEVN